MLLVNKLFPIKTKIEGIPKQRNCYSYIVWKKWDFFNNAFQWYYDLFWLEKNHSMIETRRLKNVILFPILSFVLSRKTIHICSTEVHSYKKFHKILGKTPIVKPLLTESKKFQACSFTTKGLRHVCFLRN